MIPLERQKAIFNLIQQHDVMSIQELCKIFDVSYMTIWRDINLLEKEGKAISVSGGVKAAERLPFEPSHEVKEGLMSDEKEAIAAIACEHIPQNACIYLDAGTTVLALAKQLAPRNDLTIITNDLVITNYLVKHSEAELIIAGGRVRKENNSTIGTITAKVLNNFIVDIAFISASSWNLRGISTPDENKVPVKEAVANISRRRYLITDSSKYGKVGTYIALPIETFDAIFTDQKLPKTAVQALKKLGITLYQG